jgi:hypothetical protein
LLAWPERGSAAFCGFGSTLVAAPVFFDFPKRFVFADGLADAADCGFVVVGAEFGPPNLSQADAFGAGVFMTFLGEAAEEYVVNGRMEAGDIWVIVVAAADEARLEINIDELGGDAVGEL